MDLLGCLHLPEIMAAGTEIAKADLDGALSHVVGGVCSPYEVADVELKMSLFKRKQQSVVCLLCKQAMQRGQAYYKGKKGGIVCVNCLKETRQRAVLSYLTTLYTVLDETGIDLTGPYYIHGYGKV